MDLFCPHCTRRVTIPDDKSGQVLNCPLCAKQFMAPTLAPPPVAPKPPPPPLPPAPEPAAIEESFSLAPPHVTPPSPVMSSPVSGPAPASAPPPPPLPPGTYSRSCSCQLTGDWLAFVPAVCVLLIFLPLSFFPWHYVDSKNALTLWSLSFVDFHANFVFYAILLLPTLLLSIASVPFDKGWIPPPAQVAPFLPLKNLVAGVLLGLGFLMLAVDSLQAHFIREWNPQLLSLKLAFCFQLVATIASFLMFWVNWRKKSNLPPPTCDMRW